MIALFVFGIIVGIGIGIYIGYKIWEKKVPSYLNGLVSDLNKKISEETVKQIKEKLEGNK